MWMRRRPAWPADIQRHYPLHTAVEKLDLAGVREIFAAPFDMPTVNPRDLFDPNFVPPDTAGRHHVNQVRRVDGLAPLHILAKMKSRGDVPEENIIEIARELLRNGGDVDVRSAARVRGETPLIVCISSGQFPELVEFLIDAGADVDAVRLWPTPVSVMSIAAAATSPSGDRICRLLHEAGAGFPSIEFAPPSYKKLSNTAVLEGSSVFDRVLDQPQFSFPVRTRDPNIESTRPIDHPLVCAPFAAQVAQAPENRRLLDYLAGSGVTDTTRNLTRLIQASQCDVDAVAGDGTTAIHAAIWVANDYTFMESVGRSCATNIAALISVGGADPNAANKLQETPLMRVHPNSSNVLVETLAQNGAAPYMQNFRGQNVFMQAAQADSIERMHLLLTLFDIEHGPENDDTLRLLKDKVDDASPSMQKILRAKLNF